MPLRARAVDRVGNVLGRELARNIGPPPTQFGFSFSEGVNAAGGDGAQAAWTRPGVAGSLRVTTVDLDEPSEVEWPDLGAGWTVERERPHRRVLVLRHRRGAAHRRGGRDGDEW